jgi:adenine phosphoribosyltransferase
MRSEQATTVDLTAFVRDVPDFPKPGILFKDITPMLRSGEAFAAAVEQLAAPFRNERISKVAAIESRGFIFGAGVALRLGCGLVPIRKPGKLPWTTYRHEYTLEYGHDALEVHNDAFDNDDRVLIIDDVLATGGTGLAAVALVAKFQATAAAFAVVIELDFLKGRDRLGSTPIHSLIHYS